MVYEEREHEEEFRVQTQRSTTHVARKEHKCYMCLKPIHPGEKYRYSIVITGGGLHAMHEHMGACYEQ